MLHLIYFICSVILMSSKTQGYSRGAGVGRYLRQGFLFPGNREGLLRGGLEPSIRWGQVQTGPGWGPQPTLSARVPWLPQGPFPCLVLWPPWFLFQGPALPSVPLTSASHVHRGSFPRVLSLPGQVTVPAPQSPPHPLCCPSPLHSQGLFQKHKSAQSPGCGSQTLAK